MGYGVAYGTAPFGFVDPAEATGAPVPLHSARRITAAGQYVVKPSGEIDGMDGVQQRVILICSYAIGTPPTFVEPRTLRLLEGRIRAALETQMGTDVSVESVSARDGGGGRIKYTVVYSNLLTNTKQTAEASL